MEKRKTGKKNFIWLFLAFTTAAQFLVTVIYTLGSADAGNDRLDLFVHGRYSELIVPLLLALGITKILDSRRLWLGTGMIIGFTALLTGAVGLVVNTNNTICQISMVTL